MLTEQIQHRQRVRLRRGTLAGQVVGQSRGQPIEGVRRLIDIVHVPGTECGLQDEGIGQGLQSDDPGRCPRAGQHVARPLRELFGQWAYPAQVEADVAVGRPQLDAVTSRLLREHLASRVLRLLDQVDSRRPAG